MTASVRERSLIHIRVEGRSEKLLLVSLGLRDDTTDDLTSRY